MRQREGTPLEIHLLGTGAATLLSFVTAGAWDAYSLIGLRVVASVIGAACIR